MTPKRNYSVEDLAKLRNAVWHKIVYGKYDVVECEDLVGIHNPPSVQEVEEIVRTHMLAGHTYIDLEVADLLKDNP